MISHRDDAEAGYVAGLESLAFGVVVFVLGTLIIFNGWTVVDAKLAAEGAAREAARAVVEVAPDGAGLTGTAGYYQGVARDAATTALRGMRTATSAGTGGDVLDLAAAPVVEGSLDRGECVRVTVAVAVPLVRLPLVGGGGGTRRVIGEHSERVDPFRSGLEAGEDPALVTTPC